MICQIQAAIPAVRPRNGKVALKICQPVWRRVAQRFCVLATDCLLASSTIASALALNNAARGSVPSP